MCLSAFFKSGHFDPAVHHYSIGFSHLGLPETKSSPLGFLDQYIKYAVFQSLNINKN